MAHSNSPEIIGKKMCEKWRLWDLRIKPSLFAFLEVIYSGKKRIHEIVNAHTISQGVSDGISCVRNTWIFFFWQEGGPKSEKKNFQKIFFCQKKIRMLQNLEIWNKFFFWVKFFFHTNFWGLGSFWKVDILKFKIRGVNVAL